ncbi:putative phosphoribosylglycinamide formyltransferase [Calycina marina]|uniref:Phosphoribosylglycinamide formyltransferase n=1 Tax=Calycina marina TaxID=1763456 RepID=A0A9P7Z018_9HELO|nr:putative phosphoribosylglycinamide formyltransferase [Calycina marina]
MIPTIPQYTKLSLAYDLPNLAEAAQDKSKLPTLGIHKMHNPPLTKITILISGNGSNLQALIDASTTTMPHLKIVRVISNRKQAFGISRAEKASIPTLYHNLVAGKYLPAGEKDPAIQQQGRQKYDADLADFVMADGPDLVVCAGWMHILAPSFLEPLSAKKVPVINLHPALPGMYDGVNAIERAYNDFRDGKLEKDRTGIMIHYVISEVDRGTPILVREIQIQKGEMLDELTERIHEEEHQIIVEGTALAIIKIWEERQ